MAGSSAAERIITPTGMAPEDVNILRAIREAISESTLRPEADAVSELRAELAPVERKLATAKTRAIRWVQVARADKRPRPFAESMMEQFPLDSAQGRALMSLAEALRFVKQRKPVNPNLGFIQQLLDAEEALYGIRSINVEGYKPLYMAEINNFTTHWLHNPSVPPPL